MLLLETVELLASRSRSAVDVHVETLDSMVSEKVGTIFPSMVGEDVMACPGRCVSSI